MAKEDPNKFVNKTDIMAAILANAYYTRLLISQNKGDKYMDPHVQDELKKEVFSTYCDFLSYTENLDDWHVYDN